MLIYTLLYSVLLNLNKPRTTTIDVALTPRAGTTSTAMCKNNAEVRKHSAHEKIAPSGTARRGRSDSPNSDFRANPPRWRP